MFRFGNRADSDNKTVVQANIVCLDAHNEAEECTTVATAAKRTDAPTQTRATDGVRQCAPSQSTAAIMRGTVLHDDDAGKSNPSSAPYPVRTRSVPSPDKLITPSALLAA